MNAIIALCHFCEQHGPRVLFCTQPFHEQEPIHAFIGSSAASDVESVRSKSVHLPIIFKPHLAGTTGRSISIDSGGSVSHTQESSETSTSTTKERCEGCRSLQSDKPGYVSNDQEAKVRYVSSQQPRHEELYSIVRQACIRSLSSEVCPGREGPIFFGDSDSRYVLSYTFYVHDTKSRGGRRFYSIIVVMNDRIYLLNSWPFLVKHLQSIVHDVQSKAKHVFEEEQPMCPVRPHVVNERSYTAPTQCRLQRPMSSVRSLIDMTGDPALFKSLHLAFTWVLKACSNRLTEKLLEGPPTEDSIVDLEQKEELVDDFVMVGTEKVADPSTEPASALGAAANSCSLTDDTCTDSAASSGPIFHNLRELYQILGYADFHQLAHHVLVGNQIIVQTDSTRMTRSIIDCLQVLLPKGCCKVIYQSDVYEESYKCNFLGLSKFCLLPKHVAENEHYALINVELPVATDTPEPLCLSMLKGYRVELHTGQPRLEKSSAPKILEKMERAVANLKLNWAVVEQCLICIKEEWMNKVKVLFTFTKAGGSRSEDDTKKLLQVFGASDEDKKALKFWMTGLSAQYKNHMRQTSKQI
ncbi:folliculin-like [Watersipora subatra]|uniref:folliculin-like n=1 Tax=Watersipora subatra TaxID=2589382 RepID=UPI00355BC216